MSKKEKEMSNMLQNSAVNFGLLQPTVKPDGAPAHTPAVKPEPASSEVAASGKQEPAKESPARKPTPTKKPTVGAKSKTPAGPEDENPFGYAVGPAWPLVEYDSPFLIPMPENQARAGASLSIRIPLDLNMTVEAHCAKLGVKNLSEWVRHAMARQLSMEQSFLSKRK